MKDKVLTLIIGILIGAIIASACFLVLQKNNSSKMPKMNGQGQMGEPPSMDGENGERPQRPGDDSSQSETSSENTSDSEETE